MQNFILSTLLYVAASFYLNHVRADTSCPDLPVELEKMSVVLRSYYSNLVASRETKQVSDLRRIFEPLKKYESTKQKECFDLYAKAYLNYSIQLPASFQERVHFSPERFSELKVQWISESDRKSDPDFLGKESKENGVFKKYNVLGFFNCAETEIHLDPYLSPYDLSSVYAHELDHFLRDQISFVDSSSFSIKERVVLDEISATLRGTYFQSRVILSGRANVNEKLSTNLGATKLPFLSNEDLTLFSRNGILSEIAPVVGYFNRLNKVFRFEDFINFSMIKNASWYDGNKNKITNEEIKKNLVDSISSNYFKSGSLDQDLLLKNITKASLSDLDVYQRYLDLSGTQKINPLRKVSPYCQEYIKAVQSGVLSEYLGTEGVIPDARIHHFKKRGLKPCFRPKKQI